MRAAAQKINTSPPDALLHWPRSAAMAQGRQGRLRPSAFNEAFQISATLLKLDYQVDSTARRE
jgi:hypothetical protein